MEQYKHKPSVPKALRPITNQKQNPNLKTWKILELTKKAHQSSLNKQKEVNFKPTEEKYSRNRGQISIYNPETLSISKNP